MTGSVPAKPRCSGQARRVPYGRLRSRSATHHHRGLNHEVVTLRRLCMPAPRLWNRGYGRHGRRFRRWWQRRWRQCRRWECRRWECGRWKRGLYHLYRGPAVQLHLGLVHPGVSGDGRVPGQLYELDLHGELQREQQLPDHLQHGRDVHAELHDGHLPADGDDGGVGEAALQRRVDVSGHVRRGDELQADRGHRHRELHGLQLTTQERCRSVDDAKPDGA